MLSTISIGMIYTEEYRLGSTTAGALTSVSGDSLSLNEATPLALLFDYLFSISLVIWLSVF
jgi:hypothetical protein